MKYTEKNGLRILTSDFGYLIHNKNSDTYSKKVYLGKNASLDDFEEIRDESINDSIVEKMNNLDKENVMQHEAIDTTMLVLDEVFNCIDSESIAVMSVDDESVNPIVNFYAIMIQKELKNINNVPAKYKEQIAKILNK
jgi:hypothetical protein